MTTWLRGFLVGFGTITVGISLAEGQANRPAPVTRAQFVSMRWLIGAWRGSGGQYPAFFEEYRLLQDSTIRQRTFPDSTFATASDSATIEWRGGTVSSRSKEGVVKYVLVRVTADTLRFARPSGTAGGFTWVRESPTSWTAILDPPRAGMASTVYRMQRVRP